MKEKFIDKRFSAERLSTLEKMNAVIEEYQADGIDLTLRFAAIVLSGNRSRLVP
jgi:hypothetical protein